MNPSSALAAASSAVAGNGGIGGAVSSAAAQVTGLAQLTSQFPQIGSIVSAVEGGNLNLPSIASEVAALTANPTFASAVAAK